MCVLLPSVQEICFGSVYVPNMPQSLGARFQPRQHFSGGLQMYHYSFSFIIVVPGYFRDVIYEPYFCFSEKSAYDCFYVQFCSNIWPEKDSEIPQVKAWAS